MNLVQLAEQTKNLSNQQLQQLLQAPDGTIPPFLLAAEAARRQDIERSAQSQPPDAGTVLDELIQSRAEKSGVNAITNDAAGNPQQPPQAPEEQPAMAGGGGVRRFQAGGISDLSFGDPMGTGDGAFIADVTAPTPGGLSDYLPDVPDLIPKWEDPNKLLPQNGGGIKTLDAAADNAEKQKLARYQTHIKDEAAARKEAQNDAQNNAMGNPQTTTNEGGGESDDFRSRLAAIYGEQDGVHRTLGMSSTGLANIAAALLAREPGLTDGERWARAAQALAADTDAEELRREENASDRDLALLKYDMAKKAADDAEASSGVSSMATGYKDTAEYYFKIGKEYSDQADALARQYKSVDPSTGMFTDAAPIPPEVQKQINDLREASKRAMDAGLGYQQQYGGIYGVEPVEVWTGNSIVKP